MERTTHPLLRTYNDISHQQLIIMNCKLIQ